MEGKKSYLGMCLAAVLALGLIVPSGPAYADIFALDNWNNTQLDASDDFIEVRTGTTDCGAVGGPAGSNLCFGWFEGAITEGPAAIGIDQFAYDGTVVPTSAPADWTPPPPSETCTSGGSNVDGFGSFAIDCQSPGGTTGISSYVFFTLSSLSDLDSPEDFAAHVRYQNNCSGFVSGRTADSPTSNTNCAGVVSEPSSLALVGFGMVGLAFLRRRWMKK
jgi:hypothetical protein